MTAAAAPRVDAFEALGHRSSVPEQCLADFTMVFASLHRGCSRAAAMPVGETLE